MIAFKWTSIVDSVENAGIVLFFITAESPIPADVGYLLSLNDKTVVDASLYVY